MGATGPHAAFAARHASLNERIVELIDDFSLVNYGTLNITDKASVDPKQ